MSAPEPTSASLFARLGEQDALRPLLQHFYADVRQHNVIGPIFLRQIDDWPAHLEKILRFWTTVTGGPPCYSGPMLITHLKLHLGEEHFLVWLDLWRRQCRGRFPDQEANELIHIAETMADRLQGGAALNIQT